MLHLKSMELGGAIKVTAQALLTVSGGVLPAQGELILQVVLVTVVLAGSCGYTCITILP